jgi:hypothetical protein
MDINILPINDLKQHIESEFCKCKPRVEYCCNSCIIVHNSWDGRELVEDADIEMN